MRGFNFNVVEIYEEPRKKILPKLDSKGYGPEMSEFESGFLCGLIKEFRPDTIVEAGVAGGVLQRLFCNAFWNLACMNVTCIQLIILRNFIGIRI